VVELPVPDVLIIGGGPGGYVAAIRAAQLGGKVTIIEKDKLGGTCLNRGCIPTKTLVERIKLLNKLQNLNLGPGTDKPRIELREIMETKQSIVDKICKSTQRLLDSYGIEILRGTARIVGQKEVEVKEDAGTNRFTARKLIIAAGSSPAILPIPGGATEGVLSGEKMLEISDVPDRLVVVGGGGIGVEFACIFNALGTKVTILELMPQILPNEDTDMSQFLRQLLENRGIEIHTEAKVEEISSKGSAEQVVGGNRVLVSVGRKPNIENLGLDNMNITLERGWIKTDNHMQTDNPNVFASGDVAGKYQLAYVAWAEGIVAAENAMNKNSEIDYSVIPKCTFSDPQLASVGLTENQARSKGMNVKVGFFSFSDNSRALALGEEDGGIKIVTDSDSGEILGAQIMGAEACELIGGMALALKLEATIQDLGDMICVHPTLFEVIKEAALDVEDRAIHRIKK
jgi:dihydrolipoamide dehydrogenase